jgi:Fanconi anemia group M protein
VVCKLNELYCRIKSELDAVMETTASRLVHRTKGALYIKAANKLGAFLVMQARKSYQQQSGSQDQPDYRQNMADFFFLENVCRKAAQFETDGINALYQGCLDDSRTKLSSDLAKSPQFKKIFVEIAALVTGPPVVDGLDAGTPPQLPAWRHPKFAKIVTLLADHFEQHGAETRAIVFVNFRNTVGDLVEVIRACCPKATPEEFVGQASSGKGKGSKGLKQADQLRLLEDFKAGRCNTIVATSVAEEGLDIGEVDLIICFDAHGSAIRLVQRMGRTGRKRDGKVVLLVTEGKEEQKHKDSTSKTKKMFKTLVNAAKKFTTYKENPRMVNPPCTPSTVCLHRSMVLRLAMLPSCDVP